MPYNLKSKGFTLIELIVVVVLIGIISAVAIPHFLDLSVDTTSASAKTTRAAFMTGIAEMHGEYMVNQNTQGISTWTDNYPDMTANTTTADICVTLWNATVGNNIHAWVLSDSPVMSNGDYVAYVVGPMNSGLYACVYVYSEGSKGFSAIPQTAYDNGQYFIIYTAGGAVDFVTPNTTDLATYKATH